MLSRAQRRAERLPSSQVTAPPSRPLESVSFLCPEITPFRRPSPSPPHPHPSEESGVRVFWKCPPSPLSAPRHCRPTLAPDTHDQISPAGPETRNWRSAGTLGLTHCGVGRDLPSVTQGWMVTGRPRISDSKAPVLSGTRSQAPAGVRALLLQPHHRWGSHWWSLGPAPGLLASHSPRFPFSLMALGARPSGAQRWREGSSSAASDRCCFQFLCSSLSFYFPNLSPGSAKCRNFSPSGWQPLLVAAGGGGGGLVAVKGAERQRGSGLVSRFPSSLHAVMFPARPPFPELIHRCYYSGKKLVSGGQQ